jgi:hypothetical protein
MLLVAVPFASVILSIWSDCRPSAGGFGALSSDSFGRDDGPDYRRLALRFRRHHPDGVIGRPVPLLQNDGSLVGFSIYYDPDVADVEEIERSAQGTSAVVREERLGLRRVIAVTFADGAYRERLDEDFGRLGRVLRPFMSAGGKVRSVNRDIARLKEQRRLSEREKRRLAELEALREQYVQEAKG